MIKSVQWKPAGLTDTPENGGHPRHSTQEVILH